MFPIKQSFNAGGYSGGDGGTVVATLEAENGREVGEASKDRGVAGG